jgi:Uma2 family endonuclease
MQPSIYGRRMTAIAIAPLAEIDPAVLARRRALGHDRFDEVWDGVLHMVPPPSHEHGRIGVALIAAFAPLLAAAGLEVCYEEGLIPPGEPGWNDYRVPDLMLYRPSVATTRAIEGPPELVVEIRSPGDDSFYERVGALEALIIDRDTKAVRRWAHDGQHLTEQPMDPEGRHRLDCLPVTLWSEAGRLHVATPTATTALGTT